MAKSFSRGWRFVHPDFDRGPDKPGLQVGPDQRINTVDDNAAVRQSVLMILSTRPGERIMRPDYGCDIYRLLFSPNDDTTAALAIHYVRQAITRFEPRVKILALDAGANPEDPALLNIHLSYQVRITNKTDQIDFSVNLAGETADASGTA